MFTFLTLFTSVSFLVYGIGCFISPYMVAEFNRYGLPNWRKLTGALEVLGGLGLIVGLAVPLAGLLASTGLALLMGLGFLVRLKIRDGFFKSFPALAYGIINLGLLQAFFSKLWLTAS